MNELFWVVLNGIAYFVLFFVYWKKVKNFNSAVFVLFLWMLSAVGAILYEPVNYMGHVHKITFLPYLYLFTMNFIMFYPLLRFRDDLIMIIKVNKNMVKGICIVIGILAILPFIENLIYAIKHMSSSGIIQLQEKMNDRYIDAKDSLKFLSRPAIICYRLLCVIGMNMTTLCCMLFPIIFSVKKNKLILIGLIMANISFMLLGYNLMARFMIIIHIFLFIFVFFFLKNFYSVKIKQLFKKSFIIGGSTLLLLFIAMTFSRLRNFENTTKNVVSVYAYVGQYMSESMGNFNANMFASEKYIGMDAFQSAIIHKLLRQEQEDHRHVNEISMYLGYHSSQFYSAVGDYCRAYGKGTTVFIVIISSIVFTILLKREETISFSRILLFLMYARMPLIGFCYNTYAVAGDEFVGLLFIIPIVRLFENGKLYCIRRR